MFSMCIILCMCMHVIVSASSNHTQGVGGGKPDYHYESIHVIVSISAVQGHSKHILSGQARKWV